MACKIFFNQLQEDEFIEVLSYLVRGLDYMDEYYSFEFSHNLHQWNLPFDGIKLVYTPQECQTAGEKTIIFSEKKFNNLLIDACEGFASLYLARKNDLQAFLAQIYPIL